MLSGFSRMRKPKRVAVFISGGGSTLQALLEMHHQLNVALVISNKSRAPGLVKAKRFGKPVFLMNSLLDYSQLDGVLRDHKIDFLILAGFMKILPVEFVAIWQDRIVNIHPSLLPLFPGLNAAEKSWAANSNMGVSLHKVIAEMDEGEVLIQLSALSQSAKFNLDEANLFLRRTEQHILREFAVRACG